MKEKDISNLQKNMFAVKNILLNDEDIRKLLYYDTKNALELEAPSKEDLEVETDTELGYITLFPIMEKGIVEYNRNTFIQITVPTLDVDIDDNDGNLFFGMLITVVTDFKHYMLDNQKIRLLEIVNRVINDIDNQKLNSAGKLEVLKVDEIIFDNYVYGYGIKVMFTDLKKGVDF